MTTNPHDKVFRKTFSNPEHAAGELAAVLPAGLAARIDWSSLQLEPGSFVDTAGPERHTDLLFSAKVDDRELYLYLLFEHQSTVDRWMALRVLVYMGRIWMALCDAGASELPPILPVVLHHSKGGWTAPRKLSSLLAMPDDALKALVEPCVPDLELIIDDVTRVPEAELLRRSMTPLASMCSAKSSRVSRAGRGPSAARASSTMLGIASSARTTAGPHRTPRSTSGFRLPPPLVVWAMRAARVGVDEALLASWTRMVEQARVTSGPEAFLQLFVYLADVDAQAILEAFTQADASAQVQEVAMSMLNRWKEEGRAEGSVEARAEVLMKLLELKFGPVPDDVVGRLKRSPREQLDRWIERVLTATSIEDVLA